MRRLRLRQPVLLLAVLWFVLYRDHSGLVRVGLLAALLHECGHVAVWLAMTKSLCSRFRCVASGWTPQRPAFPAARPFFWRWPGR